MGRTTDLYMSAPLFLDEDLCRGAACCDVSAVYERTKSWARVSQTLHLESKRKRGQTSTALLAVVLTVRATMLNTPRAAIVLPGSGRT